jgi:hypothetical protein
MVLDPIAAGPDGLLALARNLDGDQFWLRSDNDLNWTRRKAIWNPDVRIFSLAAGTSGWLALGATGVGTRDVGGGAEARSSGAIWTSSDGLAWDPAAVQAPGGQINQAVRVGRGLLAIGSANDLACEGCVGPLLQAQPLSWFSPDGTSWTPVPGLDEGVDRFSQTLVAADTAGSRVLAFDTDSARQFRIRETVDGLTWHPVKSRFVVPTGGGSPDSTFRLETPAVGGSTILAFQQGAPGSVNPVAWLGSPP